jgi:Zn-finger protein
MSMGNPRSLKMERIPVPIDKKMEREWSGFKRNGAFYPLHFAQRGLTCFMP